MTRVLDRLGPGVEQRRLLRVRAGGEVREPLADVDVAVVRRDHEAGVRERLRLLHHAAGHLGGGVADAGDRDPEARSMVRVAVGVDEHPAARRLTNTGSVVPTPAATCWPRRAISRSTPGRGSGDEPPLCGSWGLRGGSLLLRRSW